MTPAEFIAKWQASTRNERAACQEHFIDLCRLLDEPTPNSDPTGEDYAFEKGATKFTGGDGWADVWRRNRFAWEYKKKRGDLNAAYRQLLLYGGPLGNPPLLVVSDIARIVIRTNFTNAITETHEIPLAELANPLRLRLLKNMFSDPEQLRPARTRQALTEQAAQHVKPTRVGKREERTNRCWWLFQWPRPVMRAALSGLARFIVTPEVSKHRIFAWAPGSVCPDKNLIVIARDDDTTLGVLHSRFHEMWALRLGSSLEDRPRYTPSTTFETFPFPEDLTPNLPAPSYADSPHAQVIAGAARELVEKRDAWLNPPDLVERVPEVVPGFPDRTVPRNPKAAALLKTRTLTNLYNMRGTPEGVWLDNLHRALDEAVAAAYGWPADLSDDEILSRLLKLNRARAAP